MLWRANLYLDEGADDWNNLHPWNAPPTEDAMVAGGSNPVWGRSVATTAASWDEARWGYNEWNREFSITEPFQGDATVGLANLKAGDGKQVVKLPSFTPVRTLKDGVGSVTAENVISGSVSYSYPTHGYEVTAGWTAPKLRKKGTRGANEPEWKYESTGNPGSMDSPFDFVWKLRQQVDDMGGDAIEARASGNSWWNYNVSKPDGEMGDDLEDGDIRYVPGLGLYLAVPGNANNEDGAPVSQDILAEDPDVWSVQTGATLTSAKATLDGTQHERRTASWIIEAGTDCVGFAQRAGSYSSNIYSKWVDLPDGLMEGEGSTDVYAVMDRYHLYTEPIRHRRYPIGDESALLVEKQADMTLADNLRKLRMIVPGDIFVKRSSADGSYSAHIAIVAYVPPNAAELSATDLMNQIILIEGEFTNKIQSVIKKLSVGMYNANEIPVGTEIYSSFTITDQSGSEGDQGVGLNCQSWAIRRLK